MRTCSSPIRARACSTIPGPERRLRPAVGTPGTLRRARWAAAWLKRAGADGRALRALASIEGPEERRQVPEAALALLLRKPWLARPLAWMAAARQVEPSSTSRIARGLLDGGRAGTALRLVEASLVPFPADASLRRDRLRLLAAARRTGALVAYGRALLGSEGLDGETGFLLWSLLRHGVEGLSEPNLARVVRERFTAAAPPIERARFARRDDRADDALAAYRQALAEAPDNARTAIVREAAAATLAEDAWPIGIDLIEHALDQGLMGASDARLRHAIAVAGRNARPLAPLPRLLFQDLAHVPPAVAGGAGPVLMVGNSLRCGGMERVLAATVAGLRARGRDVGVALAEPPGEASASRFFLGESGLDPGEILSLADGALDPALAALPRRWRVEASAVARHVHTLRPRLIHAWNDRLGLIAALAALPAGVPIVIHFHHMRPTRDPAEAAAAAAYPACLRVLLDRADVRLVFCAEAAANDYAEWLGVDRDERFLVVHNGFPPEPEVTARERTRARRRFGLPERAPVVASLFRFEAVKQPLVWLDAAAAIARAVPHVRFLMPGDGELLPAARAHARALELGDRVRFPGRIADPRAALAAADLLMMSSASEGLPNGAVEAQLAGVPVVAFDVGGIAETIRPEVTGRLVPPGETGSLAAAAIALLADPPARAAAGTAARAFAADAFAMNRYLDAIEAVYGSLA